MAKIDRESLISRLEREISYIEAIGLPQFVIGLQRAKQIVEKQQPVRIEGLRVRHMKIEDEVVNRISRYLDTPTADWAIRGLIQPLVDELARMREICGDIKEEQHERI